MDAKEYLREHRRMCEHLKCIGDCPIYGHSNCHSEYAVDIVERWSEEHPVATNRMKFKEIFGDRAHFFTGTRGCFFRVDNYGEAIFLPSGWFDEPYKDQSGEEK